MEFKLGDKVRVVCESPERVKKGALGTVIKLHPEFGGVGVEFVKRMNGHDCGGRGKEGHCWDFSLSELALVGKLKGQLLNKFDFRPPKKRKKRKHD